MRSPITTRTRSQSRTPLQSSHRPRLRLRQLRGSFEHATLALRLLGFALSLTFLIGACSSADMADIVDMDYAAESGDSGAYDGSTYGSSADEAAYDAEIVDAEAADDSADEDAASSEGDAFESAGDAAYPGLITAADVPPSSTFRRIVKDGTMILEVQDVRLAIASLEGIAAQSAGYIVESRTNFERADQRTATVKLAVPVDSFEATLGRIRDVSLRVINENASGVDVSREFVDLQSEIANLEATQARIRGFLDQANSVEEALNVNARLTDIEGEISQRKGRLQHLQQRTTFSTITISLSEPPPIYTATPSPTVTPTSTPWPTATPVAWQPEKTVKRATGSLANVLRGFAELAIWLVIFVAPLVLPPAAIAMVVRNRRRRSSSSS